MMDVEVTVPEEYMGAIIGDLNSRRGRIEDMEMVGGSQVIKVTLPLSTMFGYGTHIRSLTRGHATYTMRFKRYEVAPLGRDFDDDGPFAGAVLPIRPKPGGSPRRSQIEAER
jgi:translation elongation factor EF-G